MNPNSKPSCEQKDLFATRSAGRTPIVIEISGIKIPFKVKAKAKDGGTDTHWLTGIPSFKTGKTAFAWKDKVTGKIMARPLTLPHHAKWMDQAILSIASQLSCALGITEQKIRTVASARSWIASLVPLADSWHWLPEQIVRSRLCRPGEEEGATITIERIR